MAKPQDISWWEVEFDKEFPSPDGHDYIGMERISGIKSFIRKVAENAHGQGLLDGGKFIKEQIEKAREEGRNEKFKVGIVGLTAEMNQQVCQEERQRILGLIEEMKKYHKEFECNGANNGKGCYETWCEDQNCRNTPKEYNQALESLKQRIEEKHD